MKSFIISSIKSIIVAAIVLVGVGFVSAQYPPPSNPPNGNPSPFLNVSNTPQAKEGWLALGSTSNPLAPLHVWGLAATDSLAVFGNAGVSQNLKVGATSQTLGAKLDVDGTVRVGQLSGTGEREVCANANGILQICAAPPQCSDEIDNDGDGEIDYPDDDGCTSASDNDEADPYIPPPPPPSQPSGCTSSDLGPGHIQIGCQEGARNPDDNSIITEYELQVFVAGLNWTTDEVFEPYSNPGWLTHGITEFNYSGSGNVTSYSITSNNVNDPDWYCPDTGAVGACEHEWGRILGNTFNDARAWRIRGINQGTPGPWSDIFFEAHYLELGYPATIPTVNIATTFNETNKIIWLNWSLNEHDYWADPFMFDFAIKQCSQTTSDVNCYTGGYEIYSGTITDRKYNLGIDPDDFTQGDLKWMVRPIRLGTTDEGIWSNPAPY